MTATGAVDAKTRTCQFCTNKKQVALNCVNLACKKCCLACSARGGGGLEDIQEQKEEQSNDDNTGRRAQKLTSSDDQNAKEKWKPQSQLENSLNQELPHKKCSRHEPNPYRNAQEAQEHWK
ncbi:hypothetical protein PsorP6_003639 [Peronosclerospora sorghi]|uniref:Uncharacterized protein n=1 Tax=Peronosclerospora sorghi TaxID=230839 RepID=A0ACC0VP95_9STRA|nr:hypothetical protein PsorP6_003639 [Peronosclerospora sorghi]